MPLNDPLLRALRGFSLCAGVALLVLPILSLTLDLLELRTLPPRLSRDVIGLLVPLSFAMFASVMLDFTLTISRVAERLAPEPSRSQAMPGRRVWRRPIAFLGVFVSIIAALLLLDHFAVQRLESQLVGRSLQTMARFANAIENMGAYRYDKTWLDDTSLSLALMARQGGYESVSLIVLDSINGQPLLLKFGEGTSIRDSDPEPRIAQVIQASEQEQRFLEAMLRGEETTSRFLATSRQAQLWVPIGLANRLVVLWFVAN